METIASDTFDVATFKVKSTEKAVRIRDSWALNRAGLSTSSPTNAKQPIEVAAVWTVVSSQGKLA